MILSKLDSAKILAEELLGKIPRKKGTQTAYDHALAVLKKLEEWKCEENILAAGVLHDILEDTDDITPGSLSKTFGEEIARLVTEVSHDNRFNWDKERRHEMYATQLSMASPEACLIKMADMIHNIGDFLNPKFWNKEKRKKALLKYGSYNEAIYDALGGKRDEKKWSDAVLKARKEMNDILNTLKRSF